MRSIGRTLARLGAARALLAGAAILAGAAGPPGAKQAAKGQEVALAVPRLSAPASAGGLALPRPLAPEDAERIRRIFALQAKGDIAAAGAECKQLGNPLLLPHILADRYLGGPGRAKPDELAAWLTEYPGLPDAPAIHALLARETPKHPALASPPQSVPPLPPPPSGDSVEPTSKLLVRNPMLDRSVHDAARENANRAIRLIARTRGLDALYGAQLRAEVAQILFTQGRDVQALSIADAANRQAHGEVGLAPFVAGLAAWRLDRPDRAQAYFAAAYRATLIQRGQRAGAAFWAARTALALREPRDYAPWLRRGAENGQTFYGLLSRRALGQRLRPDPDLPKPMLGDADVEAVEATPSGHRAFALLQVGQDGRAAAELQALWAETRDRPGFARSIMLVAREAGLSALADQLGALFEPAPVSLPRRGLRPAGGFRTDPALVYALARLESNFDPRAKSPSGAQGLMQLMPETAEFILGGAPARGLHDPGVSLDLGQRYLLMLAQYDLIGGDLIRLLAGYNAGPGSLGKWVGTVRHNGDPLLFIESVPNDETRAYIPRALAYTWLYAAEFNLPSPSLDELAAGSWPRFRPNASERLASAAVH